MDCCEKTIAIPLGMFVPLRYSSTTTHADATAQEISTVALPDNDLTENLVVTLLGEHTSSSVRVAFQIPLMITRRSEDSPEYSVNIGSQSYMTDEDSDIEIEITADGSNGVRIDAVDQSGDAGVIDWSIQVWTLDQLKHATASADKLLDLYPSFVAYSLDSLSSSSVYVIKGRRSSDSVEQDFTAAEITDGTLVAFSGGADVLVTTVYEQNGTGYDVTEITAANQPRIVTAGVLETLNGKPCLDFYGANQKLRVSGIGAFDATTSSLFTVFDFDTATSYESIFDLTGTTNQYLIRRNSTLDQMNYISNFSTLGSQSLVGQKLLDFSTTATTSDANINGVSDASGSGTFDGTGATEIQIGGSSNALLGKWQEAVFYNNDQSANISAIRAEINSRYSVY